MENRSPDRLRELRQFYKEKCETAYSRFKTAKALMLSHREDWDNWRELYENTDRELAEVDGRLEVLAPAGKTKLKKKEREDVIATLTMAQIVALADRLGVNIEEPEEVDES